MPAPLPDATRQLVVDLLPTGKSCRQIAREAGVSPDTVSRIAKKEGHAFGRANIRRAQEARLAYGAEWRADFARKLAADLEAMRQQLSMRHLVFNFGGRDNTYEEHELSEPPTTAKRDLMNCITSGIRALLDIDRHDRRSDDESAFDT